MSKLALAASIIPLAPAAHANATKAIMPKLLSLAISVVLFAPAAYTVLKQGAQIVV